MCLRTDPARRHGPHLYLKFNVEGKAHSVYVPREQAGGAQGGAPRVGALPGDRRPKLAADNRERFLRVLAAREEQAKAARAKARKKA